MNPNPTSKGLFLSFLRLGLTAFGGPAMVAYIKELSITRRRWLDEETFRDGVALCQSIPGATAMQIAAYVGLRTRGVPGALASFVGFGLPAFIFMLVLSHLYATYHAFPKVLSLFSGLQVVIVAIVAHATFTFGGTTFKNSRDVALAITASVLFWAGVSPFLVLIGAALAGTVFLRSKGSASVSVVVPEETMHPAKRLTVLVLIVLLGLLALFLLAPKLFTLAVMMMKIDVFAFGGGFASLPLMLHEIVTVRGWMDGKTFMDGIALGQVTPGPIVITSTFVGYMLHGLSGALVASLAIFTPSFVILVAVTPVFDRLKASPYFAGATKGIFASFVGLLFFVTVTFALSVPWDIARMVTVSAAFVALMRRVDILAVVLVGVIISLLLF